MLLGSLLSGSEPSSTHEKFSNFWGLMRRKVQLQHKSWECLVSPFPDSLAAMSQIQFWHGRWWPKKKVMRKYSTLPLIPPLSSSSLSVLSSPPLLFSSPSPPLPSPALASPSLPFPSLYFSYSSNSSFLFSPNMIWNMIWKIFFMATQP